MRFTLYITTFLFLITSSVHADIFTCTNAKGETIFTDVPSQCVDAEEVQVDSLPALNSSKAVSTSSGSQNIKTCRGKKYLHGTCNHITDK